MGKGKKLGDKSDYISPEEMNRLINVTVDDMYFNTLYKVLRYSGRRIGEIYGTPRGKTYTGGVKVEDVDFVANTMKTVILKTKKRKDKRVCTNCKSNKNRLDDVYCSKCQSKLEDIDPETLKYGVPTTISIPLRDELPNILNIYINKSKLKQKDYLFRKYSLIYLKKKIKIHAKQASIDKNVSLHSFRHYFVTQCKKAGITNEQIATWTGHTQPSSLNTYTHLVPDDVRDKIMKVDL
jgi:integrase